MKSLTSFGYELSLGKILDKISRDSSVKENGAILLIS